jgi:glycosyltransferase involved in cell wall biosynthesis
MNRSPKLKVAIVCDWITGIGGAERVVLELHKMFPRAPIYTSQYDPKKTELFKNAEVRTTWLQHLPMALRKFMPALRAWSFSRLDLSSYDLVISATGAEAKGVKIGPKTTHVCICLAPTHYYWSRYEQYLDHPGFGVFDPIAKVGLKILVGRLRSWDYNAAQKPTHMIAISTHIKSEIKKYYGRDSEIIFPPVDIERFSAKTKRIRQGFVVAGRQTPYKRIDLAVAACTRAKLPLTVIGNGPDHQRLMDMAGPTINFYSDVSDDDIPGYFQSAEAFLFPGLDDFGIVAVEAMAAGTPVIAYKAGGALDYIKEWKTGIFFEEATVKSLVQALKSFRASKFKQAEIQKQASKFSSPAFASNISNYLDKIFKP